MNQAIFSFLVCLTGASALGVILSRNAINAAMSLLLCLAGVAGLFVGLHAYLLAFLLLLVYAGAIIALFLFIIMLLDVRGTAHPSGRALMVVAGVIAGAVLVAALAGFATRVAGQIGTGGPAPVGASLKLYADQLFTLYLLPVQVIGFLLLIAMLGAIALSRRTPPAP